MTTTRMSAALFGALIILSSACSSGRDESSSATTAAPTTTAPAVSQSTVPATTGAPASTEPAPCSFDDAATGEPLDTFVGGAIRDSRGSTYTVGEGCELTFAECRYDDWAGEVWIGQPLEAFSDTNGNPLLFAADCSVSGDPAAGVMSQELVDICASYGGTWQATYTDAEWNCMYILLGDTTDAYDGIGASLAPFCAAPSEFTSGLLTTEAPWRAGWSCTPLAPTFAGPTLLDACTELGGTVADGAVSDAWRCDGVQLGDTIDGYVRADARLSGYCNDGGLYTSRLASAEPPLVVDASCISTSALAGATLADTCAALAGTLTRSDADDDWSCTDVPLGATTDAVQPITDLLAPLCAAPPAEYSYGQLSLEAPWVYGWSCVPAA